MLYYLSLNERSDYTFHLTIESVLLIKFRDGKITLLTSTFYFLFRAPFVCQREIIILEEDT